MHSSIVMLLAVAGLAAAQTTEVFTLAGGTLTTLTLEAATEAATAATGAATEVSTTPSTTIITKAGTTITSASVPGQTGCDDGLPETYCPIKVDDRNNCQLTSYDQAPNNDLVKAMDELQKETTPITPPQAGCTTAACSGSALISVCVGDRSLNPLVVTSLKPDLVCTALKSLYKRCNQGNDLSADGEKTNAFQEFFPGWNVLVKGTDECR